MSAKGRGKKKSKKELEIEARLAALEQKRHARTREVNRMLKRAEETDKFCDERIEEALRCELSDDDDGEGDGVTASLTDASAGGFHFAKQYGVDTPPEKRVVKSLIAMDPEQQEREVCEYLDQGWSDKLLQRQGVLDEAPVEKKVRARCGMGVGWVWVCASGEDRA